MKNKLILTLSGLSALACVYSAEGDSRIITADGREIRAVQIEIRDNGDLEYLLPDSKTRNRIAKGRYRFAQIPKPASITAADQKFREQQWKSSAALYRKAGIDYKLLGWNAYCVRMEAESLSYSGEKDQAIQLLRKLHDEREMDPGQARERALADNLLAELLIDRKMYSEAEAILDKQIRRDDPDLAFSAYFKKAVILQARGKRKEAALLFYQTALLFPANPRRAEALYNSWSLLSELKSPEAPKIGELLKRDYPNSVFAKRVAF